MWGQYGGNLALGYRPLTLAVVGFLDLAADLFLNRQAQGDGAAAHSGPVLRASPLQRLQ